MFEQFFKAQSAKIQCELIKSYELLSKYYLEKDDLTQAEQFKELAELGRSLSIDPHCEEDWDK